MRSALYAVNTRSQTVANGGTINFGDIVRKFGCNISLLNGAVITQGRGYYDIDTNIVFTATDAGTAVLTLYKDGVAIPGAVAQLTTAAASTYSVSIPAMVREFADCKEAVITAVLTGVAGTVLNAAIKVEKV